MTKVKQDRRRACRATRSASAGRCFALRAGAVLGGVVALGLAGGCETTGSSASPAPGQQGASAERDPGALIERRRREFQIDHEAYAELGYRLDWRGFPVVREGERIRFLNVYDDVVVAHESGATVSVLEASNGALRNSSQVASPLTRFVGNFRINNAMVVSSDNEAFTIDLETGSMVARDQLSAVVTTRPVVFDGHKVYGTAVGHIYAHRINPPLDAWSFDLGSPIDVSPALVGSVAVAVSRRGDIAMLDVPTGQLVGRARIFRGCEADPVVGEGQVFFASLDQSIYAFDLSGRQRWRVRTERPLTVTPTYHAGVLYAPSEDRGLRAIDALTGAELWAQPRVDGRVVAMRGGRLLVFGDAVATLLDPDTGDVVFTTPLPAVQSLHTDRFEDGYLYAVSTGGIVARFEPRR